MKSLPIVIAGVLSASVSFAADRDFEDVVRVLSGEFHARPTHIPLFGLVNVVASVVHPAGAKHIDIAVFDDVSEPARNLAPAIRAAVGASWSPFVQVHSFERGHEETVFVYMRPQGRDWKLLITAVERHQATVLALILNPDAIARWVADPDNRARHWNGGTD